MRVKSYAKAKSNALEADSHKSIVAEESGIPFGNVGRTDQRLDHFRKLQRKARPSTAIQDLGCAGRCAWQGFIQESRHVAGVHSGGMDDGRGYCASALAEEGGMTRIDLNWR